MLKKFLRRAQNEFDAKINNIRSDNGTEFKNTQIEDFLDGEGIKHEFLAPYTPQQNGVAERKNHTLIEMARTMLNEYKILDQFWAKTINTVCHATNHLYLHKLLKKTSYELIISNKPNVSYFRVFESKCYILKKRSKSSKFAPRTYEGLLLGYDSNSRAYCIFNVTTSCFESTCDTVFDETNDSQKEQVGLHLVDDEEASCDALQRMTIGDVRPKDPSNQPQKTFPNDTTHPHKVLIKIIMKKILNQMI
jgi:transposase InsO family protein